MKIFFINFIKNLFKKENLYCFIISSLLLVLIYILYILEYNNEYYIIVYNFSNNIVENEGAPNIINKIIHGNYYPSHFVKPDIKIPYSLFNDSKILNYSNSPVLYKLELRYRIEQECRLKLEKDFKLKLVEYDLYLAK